MTSTGAMQIGEVASRTGLSLRTIRFYEEVGLIGPTTRSTGGFRLYREAEVARLQLIMQMKPLDFTVEEMRDLLDVLDRVADGSADAAANGTTDAAAAAVDAALLDRLETYRTAAQGRVTSLRARLEVAERFAARLHTELVSHGRTAPGPG